MRVAILGNSGSGKSTLARTLASPAAVPVLDLDTIAWLPTDPPTRSDDHAARMRVLDFCASPGWIVEGCYAGLVEVALSFDPVLLFLDPGAETCVAHCLGREWEPHKYASKAEQDANLPMLVDWVRGYYTRDGELSAIGHRDCFARYAGPKFHLRSDEEAASVANGLLARR